AVVINVDIDKDIGDARFTWVGNPVAIEVSELPPCEARLRTMQPEVHIGRPTADRARLRRSEIESFRSDDADPVSPGPNRQRETAISSGGGRKFPCVELAVVVGINIDSQPAQARLTRATANAIAVGIVEYRPGQCRALSPRRQAPGQSWGNVMPAKET